MPNFNGNKEEITSVSVWNRDNNNEAGFPQRWEILLR